MYNVLLSLFAFVVGGLPESNEAMSVSDPVLATIFRDEFPSILVPLIEQPKWLQRPDPDAPIIRSQSPGGVYQTPPMNVPLGAQSPTYQPTDPFQPGPDPALPFLSNNDPTLLSGINGPQPHRLGFTPLFDATYIVPSSAKKPGSGHLSVQEYDVGLRHTSIIGDNWAFSNTAQGGARFWGGPDAPNLPSSVYRFGWDFLLHTPQVGPWSGQIEFNPSANTDLNSSLRREAFNFDGNVTAFYRSSPQLLWVLGVLYWDRVDKMILPNAGVVWNPTDQLEMRILFPKSRISYFLGTIGDGAHWLYATGEYHTESYQINVAGGSSHEQIQMADWRFGIGVRSDHAWYDKYVEVGYVIGRKATFLNSTPDFNIGDGIMARLGVRF